jgi:hypothetical protein
MLAHKHHLAITTVITVVIHAFKEEIRVPKRYYALALLAALALSACTGNYKFSDDEYRPLGDPQAQTRGN